MKILKIVLIFIALTSNSFADEIDNILKEVSDYLNKEQSDTYVDRITKLRNTLYQKQAGKREFIYFYTITDNSLSKNSLDWDFLNNRSINIWCTDPEQREMLDLTSVTYSYSLPDGGFLNKINFSKDDCQDSSKSGKSVNLDYTSNAFFTKSKQIDIGGKKITIKSPYGFYIEDSAEIIDFFEQIFPKEMIDVQAIILPKKNNEDFARYIVVVSLSKFKGYISDSRFDVLSKALVKQQYTLLNKVKDKTDKLVIDAMKNINDKYDMDASGSIDEMTSLGVFIDKDDAVSMAAIMEGQFSFDGEVDSTPMIGSVSYLNLKDRLVVFYVYDNYTDNKNLIWVKSKTKELVDLLLQVNN